MTVSEWIAYVDQRVWGPGMLVLLMGTGVFLTLRTRFLPWRNLGWALKSVLGRDSRAKAGGAGDVSPFSALMTTLAATIGTGNIVGVATALVAGAALPIAIPRSASLMASASFTPSPVIATTCSPACNASTIAFF